MSTKTKTAKKAQPLSQLPCKPTGHQNVLRPASEVQVATINTVAFSRERADQASVSYNKVSRLNLTADIITTANGRTHTLAIKAFDTLPEIKVVDQRHRRLPGTDYDWVTVEVPGVDRLEWIRKEFGNHGLFVQLEEYAYSVDGAERLILDLEEVTSVHNRFEILLPAEHAVAIASITRLFTAAKKTDTRWGRTEYDIWSNEWQAATKALEALKLRKVQTAVVKSAILSAVDFERFPSPFTLRLVGDAPDPRDIVEQAHAQAIQIVLDTRVQVAEWRYAAQQDIATLEVQLVEAIERTVTETRAAADRLEALLALSPEERLAALRGEDHVGGFGHRTLRLDGPSTIADRLQYARNQYAHLAEDAIKNTVLAGEE